MRLRRKPEPTPPQWEPGPAVRHELLAAADVLTEIADYLTRGRKVLPPEAFPPFGQERIARHYESEGGKPPPRYLLPAPPPKGLRRAALAEAEFLRELARADGGNVHLPPRPLTPDLTRSLWARLRRLP